MHSLTLVLPGFCWPYADMPLPAMNTPALNTLLHWAQPQRDAAASRSHLYAHHLWTEPLLDYARTTLGLPAQQPAFWLSPLHQQLSMHQAHIISGEILAISPEEAAQWCQELSVFFADQSWQLYPFRPDLWLVTCPTVPAWQTTSIFDLGNQLDDSHKPKGIEARALMQAQSEIQMLLHSHPLNAERINRQQPPINGVWCWQDIAAQAKHDRYLFTASCWQSQTSGQAEHWGQLPTHSPTAHVVVFDDQLINTHIYTDNAAYAHIIHAWEQHWFAPIKHALNRGQLAQLNIETENHSLRIQKPLLPPFWRRQASFQGQCP